MLKVRTLANVFVIVGRSGSGKSSLAKRINNELSGVKGVKALVYISDDGNKIFTSRRSRIAALLRQPALIAAWVFSTFAPAPKWSMPLGLLKPLRTLGLISLWARAAKLAEENPNHIVVVDQGLFVLPSPLSRRGCAFLLQHPRHIILPGHGYGTLGNLTPCDLQATDCPLVCLGLSHESAAHQRGTMSPEVIATLGAEGSILHLFEGRDYFVVW